MQTVPRPELDRSILRAAAAAALIAFVIPLLPIYGGEGTPAFIFSSGFPLRTMIQFFLGYWSNAVVVAVGIVFMRRDRVGVTGGVFSAVALGLAFTILTQILATAPHFGHWQTVLLLMLEIVQTILLTLAAVRAIDTSRADGV